jgi:hypothetical protein
MSTIYECVKPDKRYTPTVMNTIHYAATQKEAIEWLENNGGGIYRNKLHNFQYEVKPNEKCKI